MNESKLIQLNYQSPLDEPVEEVPRRVVLSRRAQWRRATLVAGVLFLLVGGEGLILRTGGRAELVTGVMVSAVAVVQLAKEKR